MIDWKDYEENKAQRCLEKWEKIPQINEELAKIDDRIKAAEIALKLEENRMAIFKSVENDKFLDALADFVKAAAH